MQLEGEFGVVERRIAVGGQFLTLQGLAGVYDEIFLPLHGAFQAQNAACALAAVEAFFGADATTGAINVETVRGGFATVRSPGRLEPIRSAPTILLDAAHNPAQLLTDDWTSSADEDPSVARATRAALAAEFEDSGVRLTMTHWGSFGTLVGGRRWVPEP